MAAGRHSKVDVDGQVSCSTAALGDPAPGTAKQCVCESKGLKTTPRAKKCATEGGDCQCKGDVYFGVSKNGKF